MGRMRLPYPGSPASLTCLWGRCVYWRRQFATVGGSKTITTLIQLQMIVTVFTVAAMAIFTGIIYGRLKNMEKTLNQIHEVVYTPRSSSESEIDF